MIKKRRLLLIIPILVIITAVIFVFLFLPEKENVFLNTKNKGDCKIFKGNVLFTVLFADMPDYTWTETEKENFIKRQENEVRTLKTEAEKYSISLNVNFVSLAFSASSTPDLFDNSAWIEDALLSAGLPDEDTVNYLKAHYNMDQVVIIFALKCSGRSFALPQTKTKGFECAFIYSSETAFCHEILHIFGAKDFYYPQNVWNLAKELFPDSIMLSSKNEKVDSFTAYLIGWTETPDNTAQTFIESTAGISQKEINKATEKETFTGFGQKEFVNGTYEGELLNGQRHGEGTFYYSNGDIYSGQFNKDEFEGFGIYTWKSGEVYSGEFAFGVPFGKGTHTFANGDFYSGDFVDGKMSGKGTLTMESGAVYSGDFLLGYRTGTGTLTYPDGETYTGEFLRGNRHGQGTVNLPDGTVYSGQFENDNFKSGTLTLKDGTVYSGKFNDFDVFSGNGTVTYPDGTVYNGSFHKGLKSGYGTVTMPDGTVYSGQFINGELIK